MASLLLFYWTVLYCMRCLAPHVLNHIQERLDETPRRQSDVCRMNVDGNPCPMSLTVNLTPTRIPNTPNLPIDYSVSVDRANSRRPRGRIRDGTWGRIRGGAHRWRVSTKGCTIQSTLLSSANLTIFPAVSAAHETQCVEVF